MILRLKLCSGISFLLQVSFSPSLLPPSRVFLFPVVTFWKPDVLPACALVTPRRSVYQHAKERAIPRDVCKRGSTLSQGEQFQGSFNAAPVRAQLRPRILQDPASAAVGPIWTLARNIGQDRLYLLLLASDLTSYITMKLLCGCSDLSGPVIEWYGICPWWSSGSGNETCTRMLGTKTVLWSYLGLGKCATGRTCVKN